MLSARERNSRELLLILVTTDSHPIDDPLGSVERKFALCKLADHKVNTNALVARGNGATPEGASLAGRHAARDSCSAVRLAPVTMASSLPPCWHFASDTAPPAQGVSDKSFCVLRQFRCAILAFRHHLLQKLVAGDGVFPGWQKGIFDRI